MLVFRFDTALAAKPPEAFATMLVEEIGAAGVVTGQDFTFGKDKAAMSPAWPGSARRWA